MPVYEYYCETNDRTVEVAHPMGVNLEIWGEVCYAAQIPLGETDPFACVRRVMTSAPGVSIPVANSALRNSGFTKLVRRDDGVYENVTALDGEARYMRRGDPSSRPRLHEKIQD